MYSKTAEVELPAVCSKQYQDGTWRVYDELAWVLGDLDNRNAVKAQQLG